MACIGVVDRITSTQPIHDRLFLRVRYESVASKRSNNFRRVKRHSARRLDQAGTGRAENNRQSFTEEARCCKATVRRRLQVACLRSQGLVNHEHATILIELVLLGLQANSFGEHI